MDKKKIIIIASCIVVVLCCCLGYLYFAFEQKSSEHEELIKLAEMDKREMENEYAQFAKQYNEMKTQINNDSLIAQLDKEQQRTEELLEELKRVKSTNAAEIARLKKELATVRAIMRGYILEIDSLNRLNQALSDENRQIKAQYSQAQTHISSLETEKESLSDKVAIASQLDATAISVEAKNKRGKKARRIKDAKQLEVHFTISKNITAPTGMKTIYVRILKPTNEVLTNGGTFPFENRNLEYSMKRDIEYTGDAQNITMYWDINEFLSAGSYKIGIFADGNNIGNATVTFEK